MGVTVSTIGGSIAIGLALLFFLLTWRNYKEYKRGLLSQEESEKELKDYMVNLNHYFKKISFITKEVISGVSINENVEKLKQLEAQLETTNSKYLNNAVLRNNTMVQESYSNLLFLINFNYLVINEVFHYLLNADDSIRAYVGFSEYFHTNRDRLFKELGEKYERWLHEKGARLEAELLKAKKEARDIVLAFSRANKIKEISGSKVSAIEAIPHEDIEAVKKCKKEIEDINVARYLSVGNILDGKLVPNMKFFDMLEAHYKLFIFAALYKELINVDKQVEIINGLDSILYYDTSCEEKDEEKKPEESGSVPEREEKNVKFTLERDTGMYLPSYSKVKSGYGREELEELCKAVEEAFNYLTEDEEHSKSILHYLYTRWLERTNISLLVKETNDRIYIKRYIRLLSGDSKFCKLLVKVRTKALDLRKGLKCEDGEAYDKANVLSFILRSSVGSNIPLEKPAYKKTLTAEAKRYFSLVKEWATSFTLDIKIEDNSIFFFLIENQGGKSPLLDRSKEDNYGKVLLFKINAEEVK